MTNIQVIEGVIARKDREELEQRARDMARRLDRIFVRLESINISASRGLPTLVMVAVLEALQQGRAQ